MIEAAKRNNIENKIAKADGDSRKLWAVINHDLLCKPTKGKELIKKLKRDNVTYETHSDIANALNCHFASIGECLSKNIQPASTTANTIRVDSLFLTPTTPIEVANTIMSLKNSTATGSDGITKTDLISIIDDIKYILSDLINDSFLEGNFPNCLKASTIIPVHKGGDKTNPNNYRPIALLSIFSKLYEKLLNSRIRNFIQKSGGFDQHQFGFQEGSGTDSAIIDMTSAIHEYLDKGYYAAAVFVDLQKAFDTVDHHLLLKFLHQLGIRGKANDLLKSYLDKRVTMTKQGEILSDKIEVKIGVPQGSILGPLLYLIYINNMINLKLKSEYKVFADDTILLFKAKTNRELEHIINDDLKIYENWVRGNKLTINKEKTKYIIFKTKNKQDINLNIKIGAVKIERTAETKYLGLVVDENLNWTNHVNGLTKKISSLTGAVRRAKTKLDWRVSRALYNSHVLSHIKYNILTWSQTPLKNLEKIRIHLNKAIKTLFGLNDDTPTTEIYKKTSNYKIDDIIYIEKAKLIHKILKGEWKTNIKLTTNSDIHQHNTRRRDNIRINKARTTRVSTGLIASASRIYLMRRSV